MIVREGSECVPNLRWRRDLCDFERAAPESLIFIEGVNFWVWNNDSSRVYSIWSAYRFIHTRVSEVVERSGEFVQLLSRGWVVVSTQGERFLLAATSRYIGLRISIISFIGGS